ncbi:MAG: endolytic transglycosylase MltG [Candidatus Saccharimonadales bacterium]
MNKKYALHVSPRRWPKVLLIMVMTFFSLAVVAIVLIRHVYTNNLRPLSASQHKVLVTIPVGTSAKGIATSLKTKGIIRSDWAFEWYIRTNNLRDKLQAGSYYLTPSESVQYIANVMTEGKVATDLITILPGQRLDQIKKAFAHNNNFNDASIAEAFNPSSYPNHPALVDKPLGANLEGYLYPDSFQKTVDTQPQEIIKKSLDEMQHHLTPTIREGIEHQGLTIYQGITLASIIEQEVNQDTDKPIVAQVFLKRLKQNILLGSDVTAFYGSIINKHDPSLTFDSPYNTHLHPGLPPSPISNVSSSSLEAVASPAATDYLFFVSGDDGKTYFSNTLEEHQQLTKQHCLKLCAL